uniref:Uncharacterized protein n=1 Tax=Glycine max TaxID=3847 RepID=C6T1L8_SOYBN|nr:unknown [Glycine max]
MIVVHALLMMQCSMEIGLSVWIWAKFLVRIACLMSLCLPDYFYTIGWREKKLVNTKGMLRAAGMVSIWLKVFWNITRKGS